MTFKQLQDATLADGFAEARRADAKNWINFRLTWLWDVDDWTFTRGSAAVSVTANSQAVGNLPADFAVAYGLWRFDGAPLKPILDYWDFAANYIGTTNNATGIPEAYTVLGSSILVGPTSSETNANYLLAYQKAPTLLVADGDIPGIPAGYHMALVHGAKAEGFKLTNVPLAAQFDADFQAAITAMQSKYRTNNKPRVAQSPAYR